MEEIREKIRALAVPLAGEQGVQVEEIELAGSARRPTVRVYIDREGGVTLDECERFSRSLSLLLDVEDFIQSSYVLEVSSPGLDRPLKNKKDFEKSVGKLARIVTRESIDNQTFFLGRIVSVRDDSVVLAVEKRGELTIPLAGISKARLEVEFKR